MYATLTTGDPSHHYDCTVEFATEGGDVTLLICHTHLVKFPY